MQIVIGAPGRQGRSHMRKRWEERLVEQFVSQPAVKLSMKAFWIGLPGAM